MSRVRQDKHKTLVFWKQLGKALYKVTDRSPNEPRWRQHKKAEDERIFKK